ncbi:MAG: hypothetical protein FWD87_08580 [Spirochaetaceae bacterium]|nr:hypothetical protein [Spirochaetaceae bacterium]
MKKAILIPVLFFVISFTSFAQSPDKTRADIWIAPIVELNLYTISSTAAIGYGLAIGYGNNIAIGLRILYNQDFDNLTTLEMTTFIRFFPSGENSGLFAQINYGTALFYEEDESIRGVICIGLSVGWRFLIGRNWYIEPVVRGGFPYIAGAGLSSGFRF